ncbi:RelA/SpoT domain-containing protein [Pseudomonas sp. P5_C3]
MPFEMTLDDFLAHCGITEAEWLQSNADWETLCNIANDFSTRQHALSAAAEQISLRLRTFTGVHSVRWRIKDPIHLLKKIVRKKLDVEPKQKWIIIDKDNYLDTVTDLIGVRALHLFKDECVAIDASIRDVWDLNEEVINYIRTGDTIPQAIIDRGGRTEIHKAGYRSIHYIVESRPEKTTFRAEIQVRTIFQEGWSEIDHKVRYPDFSDNEHVALFLDLFNGLAGSADEMGSFVKDLTKVLTAGEEEKNRAIHERKLAIQERDHAINHMSEKLKELNILKKQDAKSQAIIATLQTDLNKIKQTQHRFNSQSPNTSGQSKIKTVLGVTMHNSSLIGDAISKTSVTGTALTSSLRSLNKYLTAADLAHPDDEEEKNE